MNGRMERYDGLLETYRENDYSGVNFFFEEQRAAKWKGIVADCLRIGFVWGMVWLIIWGAGKAL